MWAYIATYQMPNDDPSALERRVRIDYPVRIDRCDRARHDADAAPPARVRRGPGASTRVERTLVWSHWIWFLVPHGTALYLLLRHRERFPRGAVPALRGRSTSA